ncbi:hypothetical protein HAX54_015424 [Datura stramonium]|uniref:Uncharacterized protein n=1 Tax=Datura stramonium TaxID=4076 RepID=A0ABS8TPL4_DATST|nr:hypothetical protein [Datura stramonium]
MQTSVAAASAAMAKEAMDRAQAKFRHAKEVREREYAKASKSKEAVNLDSDEQAMHETQEKELRENKERLEPAEARERAAAATRLKTERAAVEKVAAEARERAERATPAAQAEARERAAAEARERAEKAAAEAREKNAAAVERAASEARERAAAEARERAAARMNQQKNDDDIESFFNMGSRANSAPKTRTSSSETSFASQFQNTAGAGGPKPTFSSTTTSSNRTKASSTTSFVDDLSLNIRAATLSGDFQERLKGKLKKEEELDWNAIIGLRSVRYAPLDMCLLSHAKALAEKNQRDLQVQMEQQERHRISETLDIEIVEGCWERRKSACTAINFAISCFFDGFNYWCFCEKGYRKATLCIHPDKVQQKGATLQKYVAEKVFDMLKEVWNKFNSEEFRCCAHSLASSYLWAFLIEEITGKKAAAAAGRCVEYQARCRNIRYRLISATDNTVTVKRYAPPNQRNRALGRRKSGGDRLERASSYASDGEKNQMSASKSISTIADAGGVNRVNEYPPTRLIPLQGCCTSEAFQLLNDRMFLRSNHELLILSILLSS